MSIHWIIRVAKRRSRLLRVGATVALLLSASAPIRAQQPAPLDLFLEAVQPTLPSVRADRAVARSRFVAIDLSALSDTLPSAFGGSAPRQSIQLTLFANARGVATMDRVDRTDTGYVWVGRMLNKPDSSVTLSVTASVLAGSVAMENAVYTITYAGDGLYLIQEVNQFRLPPEAPPVGVPAPGDVAAAAADAPIATDDGSVVDVLVVYTPAARTAQGGVSSIEALIDLGISETNQAYANSGAIQRLRLVRKEEVAYTESGSASTDLGRLQNASDGYLDVVHALRDTYGADVVQLIENSPDVCGIGYLMTTVSNSFAPYAFGITHYSCVSPNYSFAHEMGHNMGLHHDLYMTGSGSTGAYAYARGYVNQAAFSSGDTSKRWRDIMAYNNQCAASAFNCTRLKYFANPANTYTGDPMGNASTADGAQTLNNTRVTVSNFRASVVLVLPAAFGKTTPVNGAAEQSTSVALTWGASTGASSYEYCYDTTNDNTCTTWVSTGANTSVALSGLAGATSHYWHVRATNAAGTTYANIGSTAFWSFATATAPPAAFSKTAPANAATKVVRNPTLSWGASAGATGYEYCYDTTNNNACATWVSTGPDTSVTLSGLGSRKTYYWHVRATNGAGTTSTYANGSGTAFWRFTTSR